MPVWCTEEVEATVAAYFAMLRLEITGIPFRKSEHNERLRGLLNGRTKASVEYKFQNISAVLVNHGQPYIKGYLPAQNYQQALEAAVLEWLSAGADFTKAIRGSLAAPPAVPNEAPSFKEVISEAPVPGRAPRFSDGSGSVARVDFVRLDAENRALGTRGEEFVFELERRRLHDDEGRADLAKRVKWRARDDGDGLGYDILSFESDGLDRLIEVKTTVSGKYFPFSLTRNELACSRRHHEVYRLYRVFEFGPLPHLFILRGAIDQACTLTPTQFRATVSRPAEAEE